MKTFSQIAKDAIAILVRIDADKQPTRSQLHYAAKQALRRDGVRNPPARLYLPVVAAIEHALAYDGIACAVPTDTTEQTKVDAAPDLRVRS